VTGASRGVGRAIADALEREGANVARVARGAPFACDVSRPEDVARLAERVERELGRPTILVNAAGIFGPIALLKDSDPAAWIETVMIDTIGPYLTCRAFVPA
jgi:NAD(P)-dependent dehydrogenase (short-subunit alcohol dehydrogenase family)